MTDTLNGFIVLYRKLLNWGWYKDPVVKSVFLHLILTASFDNSSWMGREIKKGQLITSYKHLADDLGFSVQQIRTALKKLNSTQEITIETTNKYTVITVVNWEKYQGKENKSTRKSTKKATNNQQSNNKQATNNQQHRNNVNNVNNRLSMPSLAEIQRYANEKKLNANVTDFYNHYKAEDWKCNGEPIVDWKKLLHSWAKNELRTYAGGYNTKNRFVEEKPAYLRGGKG